MTTTHLQNQEDPLLKGPLGDESFAEGDSESQPPSRKISEIIVSTHGPGGKRKAPEEFDEDDSNYEDEDEVVDETYQPEPEKPKRDPLDPDMKYIADWFLHQFFTEKDQENVRKLIRVRAATKRVKPDLRKKISNALAKEERGKLPKKKSTQKKQKILAQQPDSVIDILSDCRKKLHTRYLRFIKEAETFKKELFQREIETKDCELPPGLDLDKLWDHYLDRDRKYWQAAGVADFRGSILLGRDLHYVKTEILGQTPGKKLDYSFADWLTDSFKYLRLKERTANQKIQLYIKYKDYPLIWSGGSQQQLMARKADEIVEFIKSNESRHSFWKQTWEQYVASRQQEEQRTSA